MGEDRHFPLHTSTCIKQEASIDDFSSQICEPMITCKQVSSFLIFAANTDLIPSYFHHRYYLFHGLSYLMIYFIMQSFIWQSVFFFQEHTF